MVKREGEAAQLGLFKKEMDRGGERGANIPLKRARDSASICTPRSLPHIHHSLTAPTSRFHLTSRYPRPFLLLVAGRSADGIQQFLKHTRCHSPRLAIHLPPYHTGKGACADTWAGCVGGRQLAMLQNYVVLLCVFGEHGGSYDRPLYGLMSGAAVLDLTPPGATPRVEMITLKLHFSWSCPVLIRNISDRLGCCRSYWAGLCCWPVQAGLLEACQGCCCPAGGCWLLALLDELSGKIKPLIDCLTADVRNT